MIEKILKAPRETCYVKQNQDKKESRIPGGKNAKEKTGRGIFFKH